MTLPNEMTQFKTLFVAFACEPGRGSEPGIGWNFVEEASRYRPVWVLTNTLHRDNLDLHLGTKHSHHPIHPIYVHLPFLGFLLTSFLGNNIYYYLWQFVAARRARQIHAKEKFDLVHHVSYERYWMHSAGASVGPPFIFGPVGGGEFWPRSMMTEFSWLSRLQAYAWNAVRAVMESDPFLRRTLRRANAVIPSVEIAGKHLRSMGVKPLDVMLTLLPSPNLSLPERRKNQSGPFRWISIGRVPKWKGVHFGIQAFAKAFGPDSPNPDADVEYVIIGVGPDLSNLKELVKKLGIEHKVQFKGDLPYAKCLEHLAGASAMIHPALRDSAGLVYESLMLGVPVACTDVGLPAAIVDGTCGAVVRTDRGPAHLIQSLADTLVRWATTPDLLRELEHGAKERTKCVNREKRGEKLETIYKQILESIPVQTRTI